MAVSLSPGVSVSEIDLTTVVPSVLTTSGAFAGYFPWGPVNIPVLVDSTVALASRFTGGNLIGPDSNSAISFFTASNFLAYGNNLQVVRTVGSNSNNATAGAASLQIQNRTVYQYQYLSANNSNAYGSFVAKYPGAIGNSLTVSLCANSATYSGWTYSSQVNGAPGTSSYAAQFNASSNDELHIVVVDSGGLFSGAKGTILEVWPFVSKASDAVNLNTAQSNHYKQVLFNQSQYIFAMDPPDYANTAASWGKTAYSGTTFVSPQNQSYALAGGSDDQGTDANLTTAYSYFTNKENIDISLVLTGNASTTVQQYVIDNIVNSRKDCVAFISPPSTAVINTNGNESTNITTWLTTLARSSSYVVADSGWKYQFDAYNNVYRWIPLNGDIAGLCVYTDSVADPWFSPAGFNRGAIKNCIRLAWNPTKTYRDALYAAGVNPVVTFPGQGTVLFGDKTLQSKPSAFDRINVRRLFIVLEKAISRAAQYSLFEINDNYTQTQFISLVTPYLRTIQGRRGITDFKVVCDSTNNTPAVVDANQFVGDIYIKPARSINFIQLNFIAVGTGVDFNTVVGVAG